MITLGAFSLCGTAPTLAAHLVGCEKHRVILTTTLFTGSTTVMCVVTCLSTTTHATHLVGLKIFVIILTTLRLHIGKANPSFRILCPIVCIATRRHAYSIHANP